MAKPKKESFLWKNLGAWVGAAIAATIATSPGMYTAIAQHSCSTALTPVTVTVNNYVPPNAQPSLAAPYQPSAVEQRMGACLGSDDVRMTVQRIRDMLQQAT